MTRTTITRERLASIAAAALGPARRLEGASRLAGGSKKGVYRLRFSDASTVVVYLWDDAENFWPAADGAQADDRTDPFSPASGLDLFEASSDHLRALGLRTPQILLTDRSRSMHPADVAVVEDVPGENLETLLRDDPRRAATTMAQLAETLEVMRRHTGPRFGKVALIDAGDSSRAGSCEQTVLDRALVDLAEAASRDARAARSAGPLEDLLHQLARAVRPRAEYGLVHGELGPDHVLVDRDGRPVLIDVEGLMFFDVEWEHAFLRIRFREHYPQLSGRDLDEQRLDLYTLAMRLSLVAGPLRLLDGDFPDRDLMSGIAEHNLRQALDLLPEGDR